MLDAANFAGAILFEAWVRDSLPNEKYIYFIGENLSHTIVGQLIQKITFNYALEGKLYLVRKRVSSRDFKYIAIRASENFVTKLIPEPYRKHNE